ncbi:hypothetical protein RRF57_012124 [Xylaria bambusicola]|uniref:Uncharacterized protein n=1 Tax=Xylaria bambusicola TaxID=326684 RepID=A0AAN7ZEJ4_9PEZI
MDLLDPHIADLFDYQLHDLLDNRIENAKHGLSTRVDISMLTYQILDARKYRYLPGESHAILHQPFGFIVFEVGHREADVAIRIAWPSERKLVSNIKLTQGTAISFGLLQDHVIVFADGLSDQLLE